MVNSQEDWNSQLFPGLSIFIQFPNLFQDLETQYYFRNFFLFSMSVGTLCKYR